MQYILFIIFLPILAFAKVSQEITNAKLLDLISSIGSQPVNEIVLEDGRKLWVHGCEKGAKVTLDDKAAPADEYKIKGIIQTIKVDETGNLVESIKDISKNSICKGSKIELLASKE